MNPELELIYDDFNVELVAIEQMISSLLTTGSTITGARARVAGANAAVLLLAATFEEFIRQIVKAAFTCKVSTARGIREFPAKLAANVWKRSLERLARTPFDEVEANGHIYDKRLQATLKFCISKDIHSDVVDALAHNENNMRPNELNRLFNQIGLNDMCGKAANDIDLETLLGCESAATAKPELESRLEDFFRRRNEIAHAIRLNSSTGPTSLSADVNLFRMFARAICGECDKFATSPPPAAHPHPSPTKAPNTAP